MSDIFGSGYGESHDWKCGETYPQKITVYECTGCGVVFGHAYDDEPNIFEAMKKLGVPDSCSRSKNAPRGTPA